MYVINVEIRNEERENTNLDLSSGFLWRMWKNSWNIQTVHISKLVKEIPIYLEIIL